MLGRGRRGVLRLRELLGQLVDPAVDVADAAVDDAGEGERAAQEDRVEPTTFIQAFIVPAPRPCGYPEGASVRVLTSSSSPRLRHPERPRLHGPRDAVRVGELLDEHEAAELQALSSRATP